jgi:hypothetical protein
MGFSLKNSWQNLTPAGYIYKKSGLGNNIDTSQFDPGDRPDDLQYSSFYENRPQGTLEQRLRAQAVSTNPSENTLIQQNEIQKSLQQQLGQSATQGQSSLAQQQSQLAMRGGLTGGAKERLAGGANLQNMLSQQQLRGGAETAKQQALIEDMTNKENLQKSMAQFDMNTALQDQMAKNQFNLGKYQSQMAEWGAAKQAQQQAELANRPDMLKRLSLGIL